MKTSRIIAAVLVAFLGVAATLPATAQDDAVTIQARARFKEGVEAYDKGQYENARLAFLQAYALKKHPAVLLNLAQSSAKAGHALEAAKSFHQFLKEATSSSPQQRADAESGLAEVRQKVGRIEVISPAGTEITLDDKERVGASPFADPIEVEPGAHSLRSATETVRVHVTAGQKVQARLAGSASGNAQPVATTPPATVGAAVLTVPKDPTSSTVSTGNEHPNRHSTLLSPPATMTPVVVGLVAAGVGLAGTILFAAFKAESQTKADTVATEIRDAAIRRRYDGDGDGVPDAKGVCGSTNAGVQKDFGSACATLQQNNDKVDTNATLANVSVVVMLLGAATAAGWYLFAPKLDDVGDSSALKRSASRSVGAPPLTLAVVPHAGFRSGGLSLSGSF